MNNPANHDIRYLAEHLLHTDLSGLSQREIAQLLRVSKKLQALPSNSDFLTKSDLEA